MSIPDMKSNQKSSESFSEKVILDAVEKFYAGSSFCFFYGSFLKKTNDKNSDIDLIVVYERAIQAFRQKFIFQEFLFDVFVYDAESLNGALHMARQNGQFVTVDAIIDSAVLPHSTDTSKILKEVAIRVKKAGYLFQNRAFVQQYITNILDDLETTDAPGEKTMLCIDLYRALVDIVLINGGAGVCSRKYAAKALSVIDPELQSELNEALASSFSGRHQSLIAIAKKILAVLGGPLREGFRMNIQENFRMPLPVI